EGTGDGEFAAMALFVAAAAAWASGLGTARSRGMAAGAASNGALFLVLDDGRGDFGSGRRFGSALGFFVRLETGFFGSGFLGLAIFIGAAAFVLALRTADALLAAARFFERGKARFLGLAQQLGLKLLAGGDV